MQNFRAIILTAAAIASVRAEKNFPDLPQHNESQTLIPEAKSDSEQKYWESAEENNFYSRNLWLGIYQGLYGGHGG